MFTWYDLYTVKIVCTGEGEGEGEGQGEGEGEGEGEGGGLGRENEGGKGEQIFNKEERHLPYIHHIQLLYLTHLEVEVMSHWPQQIICQYSRNHFSLNGQQNRLWMSFQEL